MTHNITRRTALAATLALASASVFAQAPEGTIRLVVPFGAGTTTDIISRIVGEGLAKSLQQTVVVDNHAGAGGSTGSDQATIHRLRR